MTPADIVARLDNGKGRTPDRLAKAQGLAIRQRLDWNAVQTLLDVRQNIDTPAKVSDTERTA